MKVSWKGNDVVANGTLVVNASQVITAIRNTLIRSCASRQAMITGMSPLSNRPLSSLQNCHYTSCVHVQCYDLDQFAKLETNYNSIYLCNSYTVTPMLNFTGKSHVIIIMVVHLDACILMDSCLIRMYLLHENDRFTCSTINLSKSAFIFCEIKYTERATTNSIIDTGMQSLYSGKLIKFIFCSLTFTQVKRVFGLCDYSWDT